MNNKYYEDLLKIVKEATEITPIYNSRLVKQFGFDNLTNKSGFMTDSIIKSHPIYFESIETKNIMADKENLDDGELNNQNFEEKRKVVYRNLQNYYIDLSKQIVKYVEENPKQAYNSSMNRHFGFDKFNYGTNDDYVMWTFLVMMENQGILKSQREGIKKIYSLNESKAFEPISRINTFKRNCSKLEALISQHLEDKEINFIPQKKFKDCKNIKLLPFDFYLPDYNLLVEVQGQQHYMPIEHFGGDEAFEKLKKRDEIKRNYAINNDFNFIELKYDEPIIKKLTNKLEDLN